MDRASGKKQSSSQANKLASRQTIHILIIVVLGLLAYSNTFQSPFQWDETDFIVGNPIIRNLNYFTDTSRAEGLPVYDGLKSRYIGYLTFALNYKLHGFEVLGYHIVNIAIHLINAILVYFFVLFTLRTPVFQTKGKLEGARSSIPPFPPLAKGRTEEGSLFTIHYSRLFAFAVALLFVAHPLQTEAVTYVFQRFASLVSMFYLLSLVLYIKGRLQSQSAESKAQRGKNAMRYALGPMLYYSLSLLSAVLAMKTKENAFTLPIVITLYEFLFFSGPVKTRLLRLAPFLLTMLIVPLTIMGTGATPGEIISQVKDPASLGFITPTPADYLFTQFRVIVTYLRLLFLPVGQNINYDYPLYHSLFDLPVLLSFLLLAAVFGSAVYLLFKSHRAEGGEQEAGDTPLNPPLPRGEVKEVGFHASRFTLHASRLLGFGILWFFITLSVESSIIPIPMLINEYRAYLPSVGFFIALAAGVVVLLKQSPRFTIHDSRFAKVAAAMFALIIMGLASATYARNVLWKDKVSLWEDVVGKSPDSPIGYNNIGIAYCEKGLFDKALAGFNRAIALNPSYYTSYNNRGIAFNKMGRFDEAIADYNKAIALKPGYSEAYNNRGSAFNKMGRLDRAIADYDRAIALNPRYSEAYANRGIAYGRAGLFDNSIESLNNALEIDPNNVNAYVSRGISYSRVGQNDRAFEDYNKAIRLDQTHILAYFNRGDLYRRTGNRDLAMSDFQKACELGDKEGCDALESLVMTPQ
jgi:tetratricopeptide (TPR) repeat protein